MLIYNKQCKTSSHFYFIFTLCKKLCAHIYNLFIEFPQNIIGIDIETATQYRAIWMLKLLHLYIRMEVRFLLHSIYYGLGKPSE